MAAALEAVRRSPLLERPSDAFYAFYLFMHLWPALLIDSQAFLDLRFVPSGLQKALGSWLEMSNDPLLTGVHRPDMVWFKTFTACELFVQAPFFIYGTHLLIRDDRRVWPMLLIYAAHSMTTVLPCLMTVYASSTISEQQRVMLLSAYAPYFIVPVYMAYDFYGRLSRLATAEITPDQKAKKA